MSKAFVPCFFLIVSRRLPTFVGRFSPRLAGPKRKRKRSSKRKSQNATKTQPRFQNATKTQPRARPGPGSRKCETSAKTPLKRKKENAIEAQTLKTQTQTKRNAIETQTPERKRKRPETQPPAPLRSCLNLKGGAEEGFLPGPAVHRQQDPQPWLPVGRTRVFSGLRLGGGLASVAIAIAVAVI